MIRVTHLAALGTTLTMFALLGCASSDTRPVKAPPVQSTPPPAVSRTPPPAPAAAPMPAASSVPRAETLATPTLAQFQASLGVAQQQIDATMTSLAAVTDPNQADLRGAYDKYCDSLVRMQDHAASMKYQADGMRASRDTYFSNWEEKVGEIDNPTIRASAEARRKRLRDAHEQIVTDSGEAREAYEPFIKDCLDIKKYLGSDLSKSSVADLGDASRKVQASGMTVKQKLAKLSRTLEAVQGGT